MAFIAVDKDKSEANNFVEGDRVKVFDYTLFINDIKTPLSHTMRPAVVVCHYGYVSEWLEKEVGREAAKYDDIIDVIFDHRPNKISKGHLVSHVELK